MLKAAIVGCVAAAQAGAPMVKTQAPGYYRMMLGEFEITALLDGTTELPAASLLTNTTPEEVQRYLSRAALKDPVETSVNAFLVNTGAKLVLIDTGTGTFMDAGTGHLLASLRAAGYEPGQIDEIYVTTCTAITSAVWRAAERERSRTRSCARANWRRTTG